MDPVMQPSQTSHLEQLALAELDVAHRQLADAGRNVDELRSDVLALAARLDGARAEADAPKEQIARDTKKFAIQKAESDREMAYLRRDLQQSRDSAAALSARLADSEKERAAARTTIHSLEAHIARLKKQLDSPAKLVVKKALRRGRYAKRSAS